MFLAHKNDIKLNNFILLKQFYDKKILVNDSTFKIISNICPHQKSLISSKNGKGSRVCPYHAWSFDISGNPLGSGTTDCKNQFILQNEKVYEWNNLLFSNNYSIEHLDFLNLSHLFLKEKRIDLVKTDSKIIMDLFLDVDHISIVHKGLYENIGLSNIRDVKWKFFDNGCLQLVENQYDKNTKFYDTILPEDQIKKYNAVWLALYPSTMIEWQPGSLFITTTLSNNQVLVHKYKDERYNDLNWKINEEIWETAWLQDKTQAELIVEFQHDHLEQSKKHFRKYLNENINIT